MAPELLRSLPTPLLTSIKTLDWITSLTDLWGGALQEPVAGYNAHNTFYVKRVLAPESGPLTVRRTSFLLVKYRPQRLLEVSKQH